MVVITTLNSNTRSNGKISKVTVNTKPLQKCASGKAGNPEPDPETEQDAEPEPEPEPE